MPTTRLKTSTLKSAHLHKQSLARHLPLVMTWLGSNESSCSFSAVHEYRVRTFRLQNKRPNNSHLHIKFTTVTNINQIKKFLQKFVNISRDCENPALQLKLLIFPRTFLPYFLQFIKKLELWKLTMKNILND